MSVRPFRFSVFLLALVLMLGAEAYAQIKGFGFHAKIEIRPLRVTDYREDQNRFSAAIKPLTFAALNPALVRQPKTTKRASYANQSFSFETSIKRNVSLVPVSVDGPAYYNYRVRQNMASRWESFASNTIRDVAQSGRRDGLSLGIALPKRFDQMFGEGGANLRVSGYRRITFSGRSQWDDAAGSGIRQQSRFPSLNMEQVSRFTIQGTIGSKITVSVSQDNQTDIPLANRLILRYKGDEDDILKTLEAGNTTLNIPNTRFVGYAQRIQGLFGLKAEAQLGNLSVVAIASQEKGSSENAVVSATGEENADYIRDYSYAEGRIFDLAYPGEIGPNDLVNVLVYEEESDLTNTEAEEVEMVAGPEDPLKYFSKSEVRMKPVPEGWELLYNQDPERCPVAIAFYSGRRYAIGAWMEVIRRDENKNPTGDTTVIGYVGAGPDTLRIIRPISSEWNPDHPAWDQMWRNTYRLPRGIEIDDLELRIFKGLKGREGNTANLDYQELQGESQDPYIQILGLDQWDNSIKDTQVPDGKLDNRSEVFRSDLGLLIFPEREPFNSSRAFEVINPGSDESQKSDTLVEKVPQIYEYRSASEQIENSQYYLQISTKTRSSTIRLGRANVIDGSERVTLNGVVLTKGTHYNISYDMGQVTLLDEAALDPNADVQVEFQYAPFLALQKKTLLGMRADYEYSEDLRFGTTVLYKSDKAQERKPRVGQETAKAMVMDADLEFSLHPNFLTKIVDALPLVSTEAASLLRVSAEVAQSRPNPNIDGEAYVDDFESAVELLSLGVIRTRWTLSSRPIQIDSSVYDWTRGTIRWHNPPAINREEVYEGETVAGQGALQPLRMIFRPHGYKYSGPVEAPCSDSTETRSWGGIMHSFGGIDENRVQVFEVRAKGGSGVLHFDFGKISEDINGDGIGQDEDTTQIKNGLDYDPDNDINEDIGLDGLRDEQEFNICGLGYNPTSNPDPAKDNWWYEGTGNGAGSDNNRPPVPLVFWQDSVFVNRVRDANHWLHYEWQNGTDGNIDDDAVQGNPDKEALRSGSQEIFDEINAYFTFELPLSTDAGNPFLVPGSNRNGWYTYRVPVRDPGIIDTVSETIDRTPNWSSIDHVRVWFEKDTAAVDSLASMDSVLIADWGFVQSSWHDTLVVDDSVLNPGSFFVASVSEGDGTFTPPPGVEAYVDKTNNIEETQRGLALNFTDFVRGAEGVAEKELLTAESYSGYRRMEMYVHGSPGVTLEDSVQFMFRLGLDSANYYEYRAWVDSGWADANNVNIDFNELTALKDAADQAMSAGQTRLEDSTDVYRVVGRPNINQIKFLSASVVNRSSQPVSGEVWIDELRVSDVRKDVGTAARVEVAGSLADLISYGFNYEHRDAFFRGLSQATRGGSTNNLGSGQEQNSIQANATLRLSKFLPRSWGASLPLSVGYSKSESVPLLRTNSDVVLPPETREQEKSVSRSTKFSLSEGFNKRGGGPLFDVFLNRQKVSFSYNRSRRKTVNNPLIFAENYNVRAEMDLGFTEPPSLPLFGWTRSIPLLKKSKESRLRLLPAKWRLSAAFARSLQFKDDVDMNRTSSFSRTLDGRMDINHQIFTNLSVDYNMSTKRDLTDPDLVRLSFRDPKLGLENNYNQAVRLSYDPKLFDFLTGALSYSANYTDNFDRTTESRNTSLTRNWSINGEFRHMSLLGSSRKAGRGGGQQRGTVRGGVATEDEDAKKQGKPVYEHMLDGLRFLTGWLNPVRYKYASGYNRTIPGVADKLPWKYRLGLDLEAEFPSVTTARNATAGKNFNYEFGSGFTFMGGLSATIGYKTSKSRNLVSVGTDRTEAISTSWPDVSLSIRRFKGLPFIQNYVNWFIDIFSPKTGFSRQVKSTENLDRGFTVNRTESISRSPLLSLNLKVFQRLSVSGSYSVSQSNDERFDRITGLLDNESRTSKKTMAVSTKYAFSAPTGIKIPILGRLKFKSIMSIDLNVQYSSDLTEKSEPGTDWVPITKNSSFAVSPNISYSFSTQIRGGITGRWQDTNDEQRHRRTHLREIRIWTEIRF